ncbi:unnamed protein product [Amoebophrya sp. A120]|nr:unnamed protein product [Amoebophrya sp. A120]|eukprot:GSA120T00004036001.1
MPALVERGRNMHASHRGGSDHPDLDLVDYNMTVTNYHSDHQHPEENAERRHQDLDHVDGQHEELMATFDATEDRTQFRRNKKNSRRATRSPSGPKKRNTILKISDCNIFEGDFIAFCHVFAAGVTLVMARVTPGACLLEELGFTLAELAHCDALFWSGFVITQIVLFAPFLDLFRPNSDENDRDEEEFFSIKRDFGSGSSERTKNGSQQEVNSHGYHDVEDEEEAQEEDEKQIFTRPPYKYNDHFAAAGTSVSQHHQGGSGFVDDADRMQLLDRDCYNASALVRGPARSEKLSSESSRGRGEKSARASEVDRLIPVATAAYSPCGLTKTHMTLSARNSKLVTSKTAITPGGLPDGHPEKGGPEVVRLQGHQRQRSAAPRSTAQHIGKAIFRRFVPTSFRNWLQLPTAMPTSLQVVYKNEKKKKNQSTTRTSQVGESDSPGGTSHDLQLFGGIRKKQIDVFQKPKQALLAALLLCAIVQFSFPSLATSKALMLLQTIHGVAQGLACAACAQTFRKVVYSPNQSTLLLWVAWGTTSLGLGKFCGPLVTECSLALAARAPPVSTIMLELQKVNRFAGMSTSGSTPSSGLEHAAGTAAPRWSSASGTRSLSRTVSYLQLFGDDDDATVKEKEASRFFFGLSPSLPAIHDDGSSYIPLWPLVQPPSTRTKSQQGKGMEAEDKKQQITKKKNQKTNDREEAELEKTSANKLSFLQDDEKAAAPPPGESEESTTSRGAERPKKQVKQGAGSRQRTSSFSSEAQHRKKMKRTAHRHEDVDEINRSALFSVSSKDHLLTAASTDGPQAQPESETAVILGELGKRKNERTQKIDGKEEKEEKESEEQGAAARPEPENKKKKIDFFDSRIWADWDWSRVLFHDPHVKMDDEEPHTASSGGDAADRDSNKAPKDPRQLVSQSWRRWKRMNGREMKRHESERELVEKQQISELEAITTASASEASKAKVEQEKDAKSDLDGAGTDTADAEGTQDDENKSTEDLIRSLLRSHSTQIEEAHEKLEEEEEEEAILDDIRNLLRERRREKEKMRYAEDGATSVSSETSSAPAVEKAGKRRLSTQFQEEERELIEALSKRIAKSSSEGAATHTEEQEAGEVEAAGRGEREDGGHKPSASPTPGKGHYTGRSKTKSATERESEKHSGGISWDPKYNKREHQHQHDGHKKSHSHNLGSGSSSSSIGIYKHRSTSTSTTKALGDDEGATSKSTSSDLHTITNDAKGKDDKNAEGQRATSSNPDDAAAEEKSERDPEYEDKFAFGAASPADMFQFHAPFVSHGIIFLIQAFLVFCTLSVPQKSKLERAQDEILAQKERKARIQNGMFSSHRHRRRPDVEGASRTTSRLRNGNVSRNTGSCRGSGVRGGSSSTSSSSSCANPSSSSSAESEAQDQAHLQHQEEELVSFYSDREFESVEDLEDEDISPIMFVQDHDLDHCIHGSSKNAALEEPTQQAGRAGVQPGYYPGSVDRLQQGSSFFQTYTRPDEGGPQSRGHGAAVAASVRILARGKGTTSRRPAQERPAQPDPAAAQHWGTYYENEDQETSMSAVSVSDVEYEDRRGGVEHLDVSNHGPVLRRDNDNDSTQPREESPIVVKVVGGVIRVTSNADPEEPRSRLMEDHSQISNFENKSSNLDGRPGSSGNSATSIHLPDNDPAEVEEIQYEGTKEPRRAVGEQLVEEGVSSSQRREDHDSNMMISSSLQALQTALQQDRSHRKERLASLTSNSDHDAGRQSSRRGRRQHDGSAGHRGRGGVLSHGPSADNSSKNSEEMNSTGGTSSLEPSSIVNTARDHNFYSAYERQEISTTTSMRSSKEVNLNPYKNSSSSSTLYVGNNDKTTRAAVQAAGNPGGVVTNILNSSHTACLSAPHYAIDTPGVASRDVRDQAEDLLTRSGATAWYLTQSGSGSSSAASTARGGSHLLQLTTGASLYHPQREVAGRRGSGLLEHEQRLRQDDLLHQADEVVDMEDMQLVQVARHNFLGEGQEMLASSTNAPTAASQETTSTSTSRNILSATGINLLGPFFSSVCILCVAMLEAAYVLWLTFSFPRGVGTMFLALHGLGDASSGPLIALLIVSSTTADAETRRVRTSSGERTTTTRTSSHAGALLSNGMIDNRATTAANSFNSRTVSRVVTTRFDLRLAVWVLCFGLACIFVFLLRIEQNPIDTYCQLLTAVSVYFLGVLMASIRALFGGFILLTCNVETARLQIPFFWCSGHFLCNFITPVIGVGLPLSQFLAYFAIVLSCVVTLVLSGEKTVRGFVRSP